jgi:hypothetical protein
MDLDLVLNELSITVPASDIQTARHMMAEFIGTIRAASKRGVRVLRTHREFGFIDLAPEYPLTKWRNDSNVDQVERSYFRSILSKSPFLVDRPDVEDKNKSYDFMYGEDQAFGLGIAYHLDSLPVSFRSSERWHSSRIELQAQWLDDEAEISIEIITLPHASCAKHIGEHDEWIQRRRMSSIRDGEDMWNRRSDLWPSLIFCESVADQLKALSANDPMLQQVKRRLNDLEDYCKTWETGFFDKDKLSFPASRESPSTIQQYAGQRTFRCPDGEERLFEWHMKINMQYWRIHFYPLPEKKMIIIGYVGKHLDTSSNPT